jgi:ACS family hexuronate transporter-like MFS transporter
LTLFRDPGLVSGSMSSPRLVSEPPPAETARPWRWVIIGLLFLGTVVNYFDRLALPTLAPTLREEFHFTNVEFAWIFNAFLVVYALSMFVWGAVFDRLGNRVGFAIAVAIWSVAEMATGAARGMASFCGLRGLLGLGESGNWPGATRTIAAWFPARQRALGMGVANTGASLGPAIGIPFIVSLAEAFGWRGVFVITGAMGFVWLALWLALYPKDDAAMASPPRSTTITAQSPTPAAGPIPWALLLRRREVWGIIAARFLGDPIWWLYLNWMPLYLADVRGFKVKDMRAAAWVPYAAAGLGALLGGWCSGWLLRRTGDVNRARKIAIAIGTVAMLAGFATAFATTSTGALVGMSVTLFGFQFWVGNVQTLPSDYFPVGAVGSIAGFAGTAAGAGAVLFTFSTGWVVDHFSYTPILLVAGLLAPLATLALFLLSGRVRRVEGI